MLQEVFDSLAVIDPKLAIFVISMLPVVELRGGIILGTALGLKWMEVFGICLLGNLVPIPPIIIMGRYVINLLGKTRLLGKTVENYKAKVMSKSHLVDRFGPWGLMIFVGIPLPGTGVWTGAVLALLMNLRMKKAIPAMLLGMLMAGIIMTLGSVGIAGLIGG